MTINIKPARGGIVVELHSSQDGRTVSSREFVPVSDLDRLELDIDAARHAVMAERFHDDLLRVTGNGDVVTVRESTFRCDKCGERVIPSIAGNLDKPNWRHAERGPVPEQYHCDMGGFATVDGSEIVPDWHNQPRSDSPAPVGCV